MWNDLGLLVVLVQGGAEAGLHLSDPLPQGLHPCTQTILRDLNTTFIIDIPDPLPRVFTRALKQFSET